MNRRRSDAVHWTLVAFAMDCCCSPGYRSTDDVSCGCSIGGWPVAGEGLPPAEWRPSAESCLRCSTKHERPDWTWTSSVPGSASAASDGVGWNSLSPFKANVQLATSSSEELHRSMPVTSLGH